MREWYSGLEYRFESFSPDVQILHVVSDLTKARNLAKAANDTAENHLYRALILLDYIATDPKWTSKLRELLRLREPDLSPDGLRYLRNIENGVDRIKTSVEHFLSSAAVDAESQEEWPHRQAVLG